MTTSPDARRRRPRSVTLAVAGLLAVSMLSVVSASRAWSARP